MTLKKFLSHDFAVDLGTANTLIMHEGQVVVNEPSIIAIDTNTNKVLAVGREAMQMHEKTHEHIKTIKPLRDGVIANYHAAEQMIKGMLQKVIKAKFNIGSHRFVICIPHSTTEVEKRAVRDSAQAVGAKEVYMIHEPIAAALGIGLDIKQAEGSMVVDIGGGTTEIVVISLSGIVCSTSLKIAGNAFDSDIVDYMRRQHNLLIGERTAERLKIAVGAVIEDLDEEPPADHKVLGRDLMTGIPKAVMIKYTEMATVLDRAVSKIEEGILKTLEECPPELAADIYEKGIYLTGGGAFLRGLAKRISRVTQLPVQLAPEPLLSVMKGTGVSLQNLKDYRAVLMT
ncbi:MAG: rod shape-determining protein [Bernardetiaceae bacterium]|nr:rod shape-determining protein [Bernardetiaceae bacterium]